MRRGLSGRSRRAFLPAGVSSAPRSATRQGYLVFSSGMSFDTLPFLSPYWMDAIMMLEVNLLDVITLFFLLAFTIRGFLRGLMAEVAGIVAILLAFVLARYFQDRAYGFVAGIFGASEWTGVLTYVLIFLVVLLGFSLLMAIFRSLLGITLARWLDSFLGGLVGFAKGMLLATAVFYILLRYVPDTQVMREAFSTPIFSSMVRSLQGLLPSSML